MGWQDVMVLRECRIGNERGDNADLERRRRAGEREKKEGRVAKAGGQKRITREADEVGAKYVGGGRRGGAMRHNGTRSKKRKKQEVTKQCRAEQWLECRTRRWRRYEEREGDDDTYGCRRAVCIAHPKW